MAGRERRVRKGISLRPRTARRWSCTQIIVAAPGFLPVLGGLLRWLAPGGECWAPAGVDLLVAGGDGSSLANADVPRSRAE